MKLFPRLFLAHAWVILLGTAVLLLLSELFASGFIAHHAREMVSLIGPAGETLKPDLERGMRLTLTWTMLSALPFSLLIAALTAAYAARQVVGRVRRLEAGSRADIGSNVGGCQQGDQHDQSGNGKLVAEQPPPGV